MAAPVNWPQGDGEMARRIREHDWTATPLGPAAGWSERLKLTVEQVLASPHVASLACGPECLLIYNDAAARLYGGHHPAALGRPLGETFPEGWKQVAPFYSRAFAGETVQVEGQPLDTRGDGEATDVFDAILAPVRESDGRVAYVHMAGVEIGKSVQAEAALRQSEALLRIALDGGGMGAWRWDLEKRLIRGDAKFLALWGMAPSEGLHPLSDFTAHMSPEGAAETEAVISKAVGSGEEFDGQLQIVAGPTAGRWVRWRGRADANRPSVLHGVSFDVTDQRHAQEALRESKEQFRALATASTMMIYRMSADWRLMYQLSGRDFLLDTTEPAAEWAEIYLLPEDRPAIFAAIDEAIRTRSFFEMEHRVRIADGGIGWVHSRAVPIFGPDGAVTEWFGSGTDITARRVAEERQAFLLELSDRLRPLADPVAIQVEAMRVLGRHLGVTWAQYYQADAAAEHLHSAGGYADGAPPVAGRFRMDALGRFVAEAFRAGRTLAVADVSRDPRVGAEEMKAYDTLSFRAFVGVPVLKAGRLQGTVGLHHATPREWTAADISLAEETAERTWAAVERARAEGALRESEERQAFLLKLSDALRTIHDPEDVQLCAATLLGSYLGASRVGYAEDQADSGEIVVTRNYTRSVPDLRGRYRYNDYGVELLNELRAGRTVIRHDIARDPALTDAEKEAHASLHLGATVNVPLLREGRLHAVLFLHYAEPHHFTDGEIALLQDVATRTWANVMYVRAAAALEESERKYRTLFASIDEGFCVLEILYDEGGEPRDCRYVEVNPAFLKQTGQNDPTGKLGSEYVPASAPAWLATYDAIVRSGDPVRFEQFHPDSGRWYSIYASVIGERGSRLVASVFADITERKVAEAALRESEERRSLALEAAAMGTFVWHVAEDRGEPDARMLALFDQPPEGGMNLRAALATMIHPDDAGRYAEAVAEAARPEGSHELREDIRVRRASGGWRWLAITGKVSFDEAGRPLRMAGTALDVSERKETEAALREIEERQRLTLELVPALLWSTDPTGQMISRMHSWEAYTGQRREDTQGFGWLDAIHPADLEATRAAFEHAIATGEPLERQQRIRSREGEYRWHLVRHFPVRDEKGDITHWFGAAVDIDDLHELQEQQAVLVAELQHRTRNLMAVVNAVGEQTLRASQGLDDFAPAFRRRMGALARVNGLLSRLEDGHRIPFEGLIRTEIDAVGHAALAEGRVTLDGPDGVLLRSSTVQTFALALHELATNAVKYGALRDAAGGTQARLAITWSVGWEKDRPWLYLDWRESGVAVPPEDAARQGGGAGRQLIERALPYQLKARTSFVVAPDGVHCTIALPVSERGRTVEIADA